MSGAGYFFVIALMTPKITTAIRFSKARLSNTVTIVTSLRRSSRSPLAWGYYNMSVRKKQGCFRRKSTNANAFADELKTGAARRSCFTPP